MNTFLLTILCLGSLAIIGIDQASADCETTTARASRPGKWPPRVTCASVLCLRGSQCKMVKGKPQCICNEVCPQIYDPVCGSDGKTYSNECALEIASCKQQGSIRVEHKGECENNQPGEEEEQEEEPRPDPERDPCAIVRCGWGAQCRVINGLAKCTCDVERCPNNIQGVCGSDGKTYASDCELRAAACRGKRDIQVVHQGACKQNKPRE